ncbi:DNA-invertase hin [Symmachiella macrocystis]|uniref:DNA-invertase hin n=1 Tax=Symmachiella macrocystis TaxID=2527985 RepID=A0A5C6BMG3_9PLAN|nr:recombinase family protein [Symmachiella macrocystis]TWU13340.1 DNA-invertase hin [Symmachiella macrocystis]
MTRHIAIYVRVSSKKQDTKSQEPDLKQWATAFADDIPVKWYRDQQSGKTMNRPGWNRLETAVDAGRVSTVVVWRLDRLGRTASGLTALFDKLVGRSINLVSIKDGVDLSTPAGRLIANVLASVAAYENEVRAERIIAGQSVAKANGKRWGGSKPGRQLKVADEQIAIIHRMCREGASKSAMARATGLSRPTVYAVLEKNE